MTNKIDAITEQRRHERIPLGVALDIRLSGENGGLCRGLISDLSQSGMTFETDALLEEGMTLHLKLPSMVEIRGEVRHAGSRAAGRRRYGVRFHKIGHLPTN